MRKTLFAFMAAAALLSCSKESKIVGTWKGEYNSVYIFKEDHTAKVYAFGRRFDESWELKDDCLIHWIKDDYKDSLTILHINNKEMELLTTNGAIIIFEKVSE